MQGDLSFFSFLSRLWTISHDFQTQKSGLKHMVMVLMVNSMQ